jgi:hypothetical protein
VLLQHFSRSWLLWGWRIVAMLATATILLLHKILTITSIGCHWIDFSQEFVCALTSCSLLGGLVSRAKHMPTRVRLPALHLHAPNIFMAATNIKRARKLRTMRQLRITISFTDFPVAAAACFRD